MAGMDIARLLAPSLADLETLAEQALATIPAELRAHVQNVVIHVEDMPDEATEEQMELESPFDLLGLYRGKMLPERSVVEPASLPDMIYLYRLPILLHWCESNEQLGDLIRHVLIHEIGHYFGYSDDDMERIEGSV
jgi:predicted Zn-dependent protease with MMP-like domain